MADNQQSRFEKSLGLLTTRFVGLLQKAKNGVLDLKVVSAHPRQGTQKVNLYTRLSYRGRTRHIWVAGILKEVYSEEFVYSCPIDFFTSQIFHPSRKDLEPVFGIAKVLYYHNIVTRDLT